MKIIPFPGVVIDSFESSMSVFDAYRLSLTDPWVHLPYRNGKIISLEKYQQLYNEHLQKQSINAWK